jgi:hypothetical protein
LTANETLAWVPQAVRRIAGENFEESEEDKVEKEAPPVLGCDPAEMAAIQMARIAAHAEKMNEVERQKELKKATRLMENLTPLQRLAVERLAEGRPLPPVLACRAECVLPDTVVTVVQRTRTQESAKAEKAKAALLRQSSLSDIGKDRAAAAAGAPPPPQQQ